MVGPRLQVPFFLQQRDIKRRHDCCRHHNFSNINIYDKLEPVVDLHAGLLVVRQVVPAHHHQHALTSNLMTMTMTMTRRPFTSAAARAVNVLGIAIFPRQICRQIFFVICWLDFVNVNFLCYASPPISSDPLYSRHHCSIAPRFWSPHILIQRNKIFTPGSSCSRSVWPAPPTWWTPTVMSTYHLIISYPPFMSPYHHIPYCHVITYDVSSSYDHLIISSCTLYPTSEEPPTA